MVFIWIALAIVLLFHYLDSAQRHQQVEFTCSEFLTAVDQRHVDSATLRGQSVEGTFTKPGLDARDLGEAEGFESTRPDAEGDATSWPNTSRAMRCSPTCYPRPTPSRRSRCCHGDAPWA